MHVFALVQIINVLGSITKMSYISILSYTD